MKKFARGRLVGEGPTLRSPDVNLGAFNIGPQARATGDSDKKTKIGLAMAGLAGKHLQKEASLQLMSAQASMEKAYAAEFERLAVEKPMEAESWDKQATAKANEKRDVFLKSGNPLTNFLLGPLGDVSKDNEELLDAHLKKVSANHQRRIQTGRKNASKLRFQETQETEFDLFDGKLSSAPVIKPSDYKSLNGYRAAKREELDRIREDFSLKFLDAATIMDKNPLLSAVERRDLQAAWAIKFAKRTVSHSIERSPADLEANLNLIQDIFTNSFYASHLNSDIRQGRNSNFRPRL